MKYFGLIFLLSFSNAHALDLNKYIDQAKGLLDKAMGKEEVKVTAI